MFARPEIRSKKSTVPVSTFTAYETVPGAGAGVLNPGPRTVGLSGYKNVPGGAIYGEISLGIQVRPLNHAFSTKNNLVYLS